LLRDAIHSNRDGTPLPLQLSAQFPELDTSAEGWALKALELFQVEKSAHALIVQRHRKKMTDNAALKFSKLLKCSKKAAYRKIHGNSPVQLSVMSHEGNILTENDDILTAIAAQRSTTRKAAPHPSKSMKPPCLPTHPPRPDKITTFPH
jgi:hypothetical protein